MSRILCFALMWLWIVPGAQAQTLPALIDNPDAPQEVLLGSLLTVEFAVRVPPGYRIHFPSSPALPFPLKVVRQRATSEAKPDGSTVERFTLETISLRPGTTPFPELEIAWLRGEETGTVMTRTFDVQTGSRLSNSLRGELRPPGPPVSIFVKNVWLLGGIALGGCMLLALVVTLIAVRFFGSRYQKYTPEPEPIPAHVEAYASLQHLTTTAFETREDMATFYFRLTEIIKKYAESRYGFGATSETSSELLYELESRQPAGIPLGELRALLGQADLVKYAAVDGTSTEALDAIDQCRKMVDASRKSEEQLAQEKEARLAVRLEDAPFRLRAAGAALDCGLAALLGTLLAALLLESGWLSALLAGLSMAGGWMGLRGTWIPAFGRRWMGLSVVCEDGSQPATSTLLLRNSLLLLPFLGWMSSGVWAALDPAGRRPGDRWTKTGSQISGHARLHPIAAGLLGIALVSVSLIALLFLLVEGGGIQ